MFALHQTPNSGFRKIHRWTLASTPLSNFNSIRRPTQPQDQSDRCTCVIMMNDDEDSGTSTLIEQHLLFGNYVFFLSFNLIPPPPGVPEPGAGL